MKKNGNGINGSKGASSGYNSEISSYGSHDSGRDRQAREYELTIRSSVGRILAEVQGGHMKNIYLVTCPKCGKERQAEYPEYYRIKTKRSPGICKACREPAYTEGDLYITCPDCGIPRRVTRRNYMTFMTGKSSGRCRSCATKSMPHKSIKKVTSIECCGCILTVSKGAHINNSERCEKIDTCKHRSECLKALFNLNWSGFTADCKGFEVKASRDPLDQIKMDI